MCECGHYVWEHAASGECLHSYTREDFPNQYPPYPVICNCDNYTEEN